MAGDGVASKGQAYGIRSIRVDGNDVLATYSAIRAAREMAIKEQKPILVEVKCCSFIKTNICSAMISVLNLEIVHVETFILKTSNIYVTFRP